MEPKNNMNKGALFLDLFSLYIHDIKNEIKGVLAKYKADYGIKNFHC